LATDRRGTKGRHARSWHAHVWVVSRLVGAFVLVAGLGLALALRGGAGRYVWTPPDTPPLDAALIGTFDIAVAPDDAQIDEPVSITIAGLSPRSSALVLATTVDARGKRFESWARYSADTQGRLALDSLAPEAGTYSGVDGDGLLWSMRSADQSLFYTSLAWVARPYDLTVVDGGRRQSVSFVRTYPTTEVEKQTVGGTHWTGHLTTPKGHGPFPAVITLGGWDDGPMDLTSALLASRGYGVLNVGYHGWEGVPDELVRIPIEAVIEAIDWMAGAPNIDTRRVGLYGISKGAELALLVATRDPRVAAVAAWAPASHAFPGISFRSFRQQASWTWRGEPVPFARSPLSLATVRNALRGAFRRPVSYRDTYASALAVAPDSTVIPIELSQAQFLLAAGGDDRLWPSAEMSAQLAERLSQAGDATRVTRLAFPNAGHALDFALWPYGDYTERQLIRGGSPEANHLAGRRAWAETLALFQRTLRR
jgi:BAAT / Acyl-CoA thioester hydrolase C terminal/Acyl-CoA thioester hydrolase/BAAT N-terminal region